MGPWEEGRECVGACVSCCDIVLRMSVSHPCLYVSMCVRYLYGHGHAYLYLVCAHTCDLERERSEGRRGLRRTMRVHVQFVWA